MYRYTIGAYGEYGQFSSDFRYESPMPVDTEDIICSLRAALRTALEQAGFSCAGSGPDWKVEMEEFHPFRGQEVSLPTPFANFAEAIAQVSPGDVLVVAYRICHNSGYAYDYRLIAVPKGSRLPRRFRRYHPHLFDRDVNHMSGMDSNSEETVRLPENTKAWDGTQWAPISKLEYYY